jgi:uncharacterized delta-60 repeat protein
MTSLAAFASALAGCALILDFAGFDSSEATPVDQIRPPNEAGGNVTDAPPVVNASFQFVDPGPLRILDGQEMDVLLRIERLDGFTGAVAVDVDAVPAGVTIAPVTISESSSEIMLHVVTTPAAAIGIVHSMTLRGRSGDVTRSIPISLYIYGAPGALDRSFAGGGLLVLTPTVGGVATDVAVDDAGLVTVAGTLYDTASAVDTERDAVIVRLRADGTLEAAFADGGVARVNRGGAIRLEDEVDPSAVLLHRVDTHTFVVAKMLPDGGFDPSFGSNVIDGGKLQLRADDFSVPRGDIVVLPDGSIIVAYASCPTSADCSSIARPTQFVRLLSNGQIDPSFGTGGVRELDLGVERIVRTSTGGLVALGSSDPSSTVGRMGRFTDQGALVAGFGDGGVVDVAGASTFFCMHEVASGNVVAVEFTTTNRSDLVRLTPSGVADPTFGDAGVGSRVTALTGRCEIGVQPDGKLLLARTRLVRFDQNGFIDKTFNDGGVSEDEIGSWFVTWRAVSVQPDGRIVVGGYATTISGGRKFAVARYWP